MPSKAKVLVFYGGDKATLPRSELLAWLRKGEFPITADTVADDTPNSLDEVNNRVDTAILGADAAIAILTPDVRSPSGAPNVIDEIGRWTGSKSREMLLVLRHREVEPISNRAGEVYVQFGERITETFEKVRSFLSLVTQKASANPEKSTQLVNLGAEFLAPEVKPLVRQGPRPEISPGLSAPATNPSIWGPETYVFFYERMCDAFGGKRGVFKEANPTKAVELLRVLLRAPLNNKGRFPIWNIRDLGSLETETFEVVDPDLVKIGRDRYRVGSVVAIRAMRPDQECVLLFWRPEVRTGLSPYAEAAEHYAVGPDGKLYTQAEYDDGAAIRDGKSFRVEAIRETRRLKAGCLLLCGQFSAMHQTRLDIQVEEWLKCLTSGERDLDAFLTWANKLPKHDKLI